MSTQTRQREVSHAIETVLSREAGAERYRRTQLRARSGRPAALDPRRPSEFDESGFASAQRDPSLVTRVARLLNPN